MKFLILLLLVMASHVEATECAKDAKKFCQSVDPGRGQLAKCLTDYQDQLSPACLKELKDFKQSVGKKSPCFEDLTDFCANIPSDPRNFEYCLLKHESRLSQTCSVDFKKKKGNILVRDVCAQDIANTCYKEVSEPEGAITRCLIKNKNKLSKFCQQNVDKRIAKFRKNNPCFDDTENFCPTQLRFVEIQDCLSKNTPKLRPECQKIVKNEQHKMKSNACYRDLITHCKRGINPKEQSDCLTLNEEHLSNACRQYRVVEKTKIDQMVKNCEEDRLKLCKDVPFKNGQVVKCLRQNKTKVSPLCSKLL